MGSSLFQKCLEKVYNNFKKDTAKMLVITGTIGWGLSSLAQTGAILVNPKIKREQKTFLVPQTLLDAVVNIGAFFLITQATKRMIAKMCSTGKIAPQNVRNFLNKNKELYGDKVGKLSLDLDKVLAKEPEYLQHSYNTYKNHVTTLGTVGASILATNIVTPIIRNSGASSIQKYYNNRTQPSGNMKI